MEGWRKTTQKLGNKSVEFLRAKFDENNMSNHKDNIKLMSSGDRYKMGFTITTGGDDIILFNEFGTGVVGQGTSPLADLYGWQYNVGPMIGKVPDGAVSSYAKKWGVDEETAREELEAITTPNTWWYYKNKRWWHTEGMRAKNMFADLEYELMTAGYKDYAIGLYKSGGGTMDLEDYFRE